jgi:hypothetical protein
VSHHSFPPSLSLSGADTLRCLTMATVDTPGPREEMNLEEMNLEDPKNFVQYEVHVKFCAEYTCMYMCQCTIQ